jgi:N-acetylglucosamine-6-phosphate deacetylase
VAERSNLFISDDRIDSILEDATSPLPSADEVIDIDGFTLYPGLTDLHIHGAVGVDTMEADATDLIRVSEFLATQGVTGWLPTLVPGPDADYRKAIQAIEDAIREQQGRSLRSESFGSRILGVHYEGPFVNSAQCGALRAQFFRTFTSAQDIDSLPRISVPDGEFFKHMITVAPEIDGGIELVRELTRGGWVVSIGHTRAEFDLLDQALEAGAHHMTHFMNAMSPLHHRSPGPVAWGLMRDEVTVDLIADGIHLDRRILKLLMKLKSADGLILISDAVAAAGLGDGDYQIWGETINVSGGRTRNTAGSIAGSVISMLDAFRTMKSLGVSEVELAQMAATNPSRLLGMDHDCGAIEEGKRADLIALDADEKLVLTMIEGLPVFDAR